MQATTTALVASPARAFIFHGCDLQVATDAADAWVGVSRICDALGIAAAMQRRRLQRTHCTAQRSPRRRSRLS